MDQPRLKGFSSRGKRPSSSETKRRTERTSTVGPRELFVEYEGFLVPSKPRPQKPSIPFARPSTPQASQAYQGSVAKLSAESILSASSLGESRKNSSGFRGATDRGASNPKRVRSRRMKDFLSFGCSSRMESKDSSIHAKSGRGRLVEEEIHTQTPTSGWLHRCMSTSLKSNRPYEPSIPSLAPPPYQGSSNLEDEDFTALPAMPSPSTDPPKPSLVSGAAARAAAAAQNELFDSIRNMRLAEPKLTRDSESGVGIDVQDRADSLAEFDFGIDLPIVRKGENEAYDTKPYYADSCPDPLSVLPEELVGHILSFLDASSLMQAELVSHDWHRSASSQHVWGEVFRAEFQEHSQSSAATARTGPGLGRALFGQNWKNMWRARKALQQRWLDGYAAAIYLEGHTDSVYCVQFDEDKILTGSRDRTVRIWDARTYECNKVLGVQSRNAQPAVPPLPADTAEHGPRPFTKVFSSRLKNEHTITPPWPYMYHNGSILCLQYDAEVMITGSSDYTLIVWDVKADYRPIRRLRGHSAGVLDVCFDDKHIVSCSKDATVCLWDRHTGQFLRRLSGHRGPVNAVQLRSNLVVSASGDGVAKLWNLASGLCIKEFPSKDRGMACVEFSLDSRTVLAGGNDQVIYQFDTSSGELVREMKGHQGLVRSLHLDSASGRVISGSYDTSVKAYDLRSGETIVNFTKWTSSWILSAKSDYRRIIATSQDSRAVIMDFGYRLPGIESLEA